MSSPQTASPDGKFQNRIERLAEKHAPAAAARAQVQVIPHWSENFMYPLSLIGAALVGMLAVVLSRYVRFQLLGGSLAGDDADIAMLMDGALAAGCSFMLFTVLRYGGAVHKAAQAFGIAAMILVMHNFVHWMPRAFDLTFSPKWTSEVIAMTEPNSLLFRGVSFALAPENVAEEDAEPAKPVVRRFGKL
ncbi:hypothetical protein EF888_18025 [Silicimonas algicola]|uniref:Uncharacterized protein n=1 Tax=Silicimonas algicola TaxID=1826607 RepID=A0A316G631_9RHOB|nr:hypothetical protein [Silicimonas algicola]AZQ68859.1 hypothetical protein EF888_18025 [Silicimonas algicola]PWK56052.1 hypothetical protein C8D95_105117 [Silicimonas algicola]